MPRLNRPFGPIFLAICWVLSGCLSPLFAQPPAEPAKPPIFEYPARAEAARQLMLQGVLRARLADWENAEALCLKAAEIAPFLADAHYNLACIQNLREKTAEAYASLDAAIAAGFADAEHLARDDDWKSQREKPEFAQRLKRLREKPATIANSDTKSTPVKDGVALVSAENSSWDSQAGLVRIAFSPAENAPAAAIVEGQGEVGKKLREWFAEGSAAGHQGDYYDNCDRDHSTMNRKTFPQLTFIEYGPEIAKQTGYGLQIDRLYNGVVLGNSSTAQTAGPNWRSNPRMAYFRGGGINALVRQYTSNHLYFYPEHRDHDPGHNGPGEGFGDLYPTNSPYMVISQGSSGSDQAFLTAFAATLAAFRPEVKQKLVAEGAIAPTLQMVFRRSNKQTPDLNAYFTGLAHPTVFEGKEIDTLRMIELAHSLTLETLPPLAALKVVAEERALPGRDYFDIGERERLFDTPSAAARLWRSTAGKRKYLLTADGSRSLTGAPLKFRWVLLRGDPQAVEIKPLDEAGSRAEITLKWRPRRPIAEGSKMESNRVDIGLFALSGEQVSAPAFFCLTTLDNEDRKYDDNGRLLSITYTGAEEAGNYVDPAYDLPKSWRDDYRYDAAGHLLGWTRVRGENREQFSAQGLLSEKTDELGRCVVGRTVRYVAQQPKPNKPPILKQELGDARITVVYGGADDFSGRIEKAEKIQSAE